MMNRLAFTVTVALTPLAAVVIGLIAFVATFDLWPRKAWELCFRPSSRRG